MPRILVVPMVAAFSLIALASALGQGSSPPLGEKPTPFYCPVAGMPEAKACCCPGGYCPLKPSPKYAVEYKGAKLQMCCSQCDKVFKETPAKFAAVANHQLVATKQAKQVKCPMCGKEVSDGNRLAVAGITIAFCSEECVKTAAEVAPKDRVARLFGDAAFARGFTMLKAQSPSKGKVDGQ